VQRTTFSESIILPEVNHVSNRILKRGQLTIFDCLNFVSVNPFRPQVFNSLTDVLDLGRHARCRFLPVSSCPGWERVRRGRRQHRIGRQYHAKSVLSRVRLNRKRSAFRYQSIIEDTIEVKFRHGLNPLHFTFECSSRYE
jgi:hypothetical protein